MSFVRPEAQAAIFRFREVLVGAGVVLLGLNWVLRAGGLLATIAPFVIVLGGALIWLGWQRARFRTGSGGRGAVEVDEGQITYLGPLSGGAFVNVRHHRSGDDGRRAGGDPLQQADRQQRLQTRSERAGDGAGEIAGKADEERRAAAKPIGDRAGQQLRHGETHQKHADHQLGLGRRRIERRGQAGQRRQWHVDRKRRDAGQAGQNDDHGERGGAKGERSVAGERFQRSGPSDFAIAAARRGLAASRFRRASCT